MKRRHYLTEYHKLIDRFVRAGLKYIRKVFWQLTKRQCKRYAAQLKSMRKALKGLSCPA